MRLIAISMIRNEADILPAFLEHCSDLFDETLVVDHMSVDGSAEILASAQSQMNLRVWRFPYQAYLQHQVTSALVREAFARGADWVFPLDTDEFPPVSSRSALIDCLPTDALVARWNWRSLWPCKPQTFSRFEANTEYEAYLDPHRVSKVIISRRALDAVGEVSVGQGNHVVQEIPRTEYASAGLLYHIPLRQAERLALKTFLGNIANRARPDYMPGQARQWSRVLSMSRRATDMKFAASKLEPNLRAMALTYPTAPPEQLAATEIFRWGPIPANLNLPLGISDSNEIIERDAATPWLPT